MPLLSSITWCMVSQFNLSKYFPIISRDDPQYSQLRLIYHGAKLPKGSNGKGENFPLQHHFFSSITSRFTPSIRSKMSGIFLFYQILHQILTSLASITEGLLKRYQPHSICQNWNFRRRDEEEEGPFPKEPCQPRGHP